MAQKPNHGKALCRCGLQYKIPPIPKSIRPLWGAAYNDAMPPIFHPMHFAQVPVWLWPVLCLRLVRFALWVQAFGREVLFTVTPEAQIIVHAVEDDPDDLNAWLYRRARAPRPHLYPCFDTAGDGHMPLIVRACARAMEVYGCFIVWVWVRLVARALPAIDDSS